MIEGRVGLVVALLVGVGGGCGGEDDAPGGVEAVHVVPSCEDGFEAPLPDGSGGVECATVGASTAPLDGPWPDASGLPDPVVYCEQGATGGDGSMASPVGTLGEALALSPATIVASRGTWTLSAPVELDRSVVLVGVDPAGGTVFASDGGPALSVSGTGVEVELRSVELGGVSVSDSARVVARDVRVRDADVGFRVMGAELDLENVSVLGSASVAVWATGGSRVTADRLLARDGARYGVVAEDSRLALTDTLVSDNGRDGVVVLGGMAGETHTFTRVASLRNGVTAMRAEGTEARVAGTELVLAGTRVPAGTTGGDGLFVGGGASVELDSSIDTDARRGHGSQLVGNARTGLLASGADTSLAVRGAVLGSNDGPGAFIQSSAESSVVGYSLVDDNDGLGIGVSSAGRVIEIPCNFIQGTHVDTIETNVGALEVGDGLSMAEGTATATVTGNVISDNARFGAVFSGADAILSGNTGSGNRYGLGSYGGDVDVDATNSIEGTTEPPAAPPTTARGEVALTAAMP